MNNRIYSWILFLMNPFVAMVIAFKDYYLPYAKNIFWAFCTFYGLTFAIGDENARSDIVRYISELQFFYSQDEFSITDAIRYFLASGEIDILRTFLSYIISRFTESQWVLTLVYGFIFGFFFSRNIWYVFSLLKHKLTFLEKFLLLALILVIPIWFLNGFRMYTAFHIFMYGLLPYIFENKKKSLLFAFLSFLVHFSFIIPISVVIVYMIFGNQLRFYFLIFIATIFIQEIDVNIVNEYIEKYVPVALDERSSSYRTEDRVELIKENLENDSRTWYVAWHRKLLSWCLMFLLAYFFIGANSLIRFVPKWKKLFCFCLMFYSVANILGNLPSGTRFLTFAFFLSIVMVILYINQFRNDTKFKNIVIILTPAFLLFIVISIRIGLYSTSLNTIIGNPITAFFMAGENISLNDLIK